MAFIKNVIYMLLIIKMVHGFCPPLWTEFKGKCYRLFEGKTLKFLDAETACNNFKLEDCSGIVTVEGHLVSIHSQAEQDFLVSYIQSSLPCDFTASWNPQVYIGAQVGSNNSYTAWTDNSTYDYSGWYSGEPNDGPNSNGVLAAGGDFAGYWADVNLNTTFNYICQLPGVKYWL